MRRIVRCGVGLLLAAGIVWGQQEQDPPFQAPRGVRIERDVVYASPGGRNLHADIFSPTSGGGPFPGIIFIHGGGWRNGDRKQYQRQAAHMATKGFVSMAIEYRLSGEAKWPAAIDDCKAAVRWFWVNQWRRNLDPRRVGVAGGSAGGHLAALMGVTNNRDSFGDHLENPTWASRVAAVAAFNPALDFEELAAKPNTHDIVAQFLGKTYEEDPDLWRFASPITHVGKSAPPTLFLHGTADETTPYGASVRMKEIIRAAGVEAEIFTADGAGHGFFNRPPWYQPTLEAMERFFVRVLK